MRRQLWWFASLCVAVFASGSQAQTPGLRLIPAEAELVLVAPQPSAIWKIVYEHPLAKELRKNELVQSVYDSANLRRLEQLVAYFEKKVDKPRTKIFEELTARGVVLGARLSSKPGVVVVMHARDEAFLRTVATEALELVNQELERQESKDRIRKGEYAGTVTHHFGKGAHFALAGQALIFATDEGLLHKALDITRIEEPAPKESVLARLPKRERGKDVILWSWLDFEGVQRNKEFAEGLKAATTDPFLQLFAGGFLNVLKRTPYIDFELTQEGKDFRFKVEMPRGLKGMSELARSFVPDDTKRLLPPLLPPRVLSSTTWTFDLGTLWKNKKAWLGDQADKDIGKAERDIKPFLGGQTLGELLEGAGWNQRFVLAEEGTSPYKIKPGAHITPFGVVFEMRDERFGATMNKVLRAGALIATFKFGLKMREETHKGHTVVCYYFDESRKMAADMENVRFNFSPSFAIVGKNLVVASTAELARDLIDCVSKEETRLPAGTSWRTDFFASGLATNLEFVRKDLLTATILDQGLAPDDAKKQIDALTDLVRSLGTLRWQIHYGADDYRMDFHWEYGKK
jgi:hypothetical protein